MVKHRGNQHFCRLTYILCNCVQIQIDLVIVSFKPNIYINWLKWPSIFYRVTKLLSYWFVQDTSGNSFAFIGLPRSVTKSEGDGKVTYVHYVVIML